MIASQHRDGERVCRTFDVLCAAGTVTNAVISPGHLLAGQPCITPFPGQQQSSAI